MLFHVTMTHTPDNCPAQMPPDNQKEFFDHFFKFKQDYQIEPVGHVKDMIAAFQAQLAKQ
jgi:hypothetical protein